MPDAPVSSFAANMWLKCEKGGIIGLHFDGLHTIGLFELEPSRCSVSGLFYLASDNWPGALLTSKLNGPSMYPASLTLEPGRAYYVGDLASTVHGGDRRHRGEVRYLDNYEETTREIKKLFPNFERAPASKAWEEGTARSPER
jgi:hypothetical protein